MRADITTQFRTRNLQKQIIIFTATPKCPVKQTCSTAQRWQKSKVNGRHPVIFKNNVNTVQHGRCRWPRILRRGSAAVRLLGLRVRISQKALVSLSLSLFECCVLLRKILWVGLITCPEKSYRLLYVWDWSWSPVNEMVLTNRGLAPWEKK